MFAILVVNILSAELTCFHFPAVGSGSENRFTIRTHNNESIFLASEGSTQRDRLLWGSSRAFMMHLMDRQHQESLTFRRELACHCFCFPLKKQCLEVWLHSGILLGVIQEQFSFKNREFAIESERGEILFRVTVSLGNSLCMAKEQHFRVMTADRAHQSGTITRFDCKDFGLHLFDVKSFRQWNSDINSYSMNIYFADPTMDPKLKSLFIGLGFLLEYLFFQSSRC